MSVFLKKPQTDKENQENSKRFSIFTGQRKTFQIIEKLERIKLKLVLKQTSINLLKLSFDICI